MKQDVVSVCGECLYPAALQTFDKHQPLLFADSAQTGLSRHEQSAALLADGAFDSGMQANDLLVSYLQQGSCLQLAV